MPSRRVVSLAVLSFVLPAAGAGAQDAQCMEVPDSRCPEWTAVHDGGAGGGQFLGVDRPAAVATSPSTVFVTGRGTDDQTGADIVTIAYDPGTGVERWVARYAGPGGGHDEASGVAVSPDGERVFVTGVQNRSSAREMRGVTIAYDAATGAQLWVTLAPGLVPWGGLAQVGVSPDEGRVYVATKERDPSGGTILVVRARDAATGNEVWEGQHPAADTALGPVLAVSPAGDRVFAGVTDGYDSDQGGDYLVAAFRADDEGPAGQLLWTARYDGPYDEDLLRALVSAPDGSAVFATGQSDGAWRTDAATVAFRAADGAQLWASRFETIGWDTGSDVAVSPGGDRVYVAGKAEDHDQTLLSASLVSSTDALVVAYDALTGEQEWFDLQGIPGYTDEGAVAVEVAPGGEVYAAGFSAPAFSEYGPAGGGGGTFDSKGNKTSHAYNTAATSVATLAYSAQGGLAWTARVAAPPGGTTVHAVGLATSADGVFMAATLGQAYADSEYEETSNYTDYLTLGFRP